ncbi:hypothetical protein N665_0642s0004 [Sinapis alba]|nr:hypothetical protein N665_0642s0004 [Sinapis alba]
MQLILKYPSLRVAYVDEREETADGKSPKVFYYVLLKRGGKFDEHQEIYRIKLTGPPAEIGEGKPSNQNHAIILTRGEALQIIDMNQYNYFEETFKLRNVLEEFKKERVGRRKPTILGHREHIFTGSVSSLVWFMSNQESNFVTVGQRILANPLRLWLATQSIFQLGFLMGLPMVMEIGLEEGFRSAILDFFIMQFQLASMLFHVIHVLAWDKVTLLRENNLTRRVQIQTNRTWLCCLPCQVC